MKTFALLGLLLLALPLRADILANGGFADGTAHWSGDAHAGDNGGIVIQLDTVKWTSVSQTFNTRETALDFSVSFQTSGDFGFYKGGAFLSQSVIADLTGISYRNAIGVKPNTFLVMVVDPAAGDMKYGRISVTPNDANPQTQNGALVHLIAHEEKTIYLVFPPGLGSITLLNIALTPKGAAASSDSSPLSN